MNILIYLVVNAFAVLISSQFIAGVHVKDFFTAVVVGVVLGIINTILKPILVLLTLPITFLTLGLFILFLNGLLVILASFLVPGFTVDSIVSAILFSIVLSIVSWFLNRLKK